MKRRAEPRALVALSVLLLSGLLMVTGARAQCPPPNAGGYFDRPDTEQWAGPSGAVWDWEYVPPGGTLEGYTLPFPGGVYVAGFQPPGGGDCCAHLLGMRTDGGGVPLGCNFPTDYFPNAEFPNLAWHSLGASTCNYYAGQFPAEIGFVYCDPNACGNTIKEPWEECDDGNSGDGDGCDSSCQSEWSCSGSRTATASKDEVVLLSVKLATGDPSGDEGNVGIRISSPQDPSLNYEVKTFGTTQKIHHTVQIPLNGDLDVEWVGPRSGDESCVMTTTVFLHDAMHYKKKKTACNAQAAMTAGQFVIDAGLTAASLGASGAVKHGLKIVGVVQKPGLSDLDAAFGEICDDPPDPNFEELVIAPSPAPLPPEMPISGNGGPNELDAATAASINAVGHTLAEATANGIALQRSIRKQAGAHAARASYWESQQAKMVARYRRRLGSLLAPLFTEMGTLRTALEGQGVNVTPTIAEIEAAASLPFQAEELDWLRALGATEDLITELMSTREEEAFTGVPYPFPAALTNPEWLGPLLNVTAALGGAGDLMCYRATPVGGTSLGVGAVTDRFGISPGGQAKSPFLMCNAAALDDTSDEPERDHRNHVVAFDGIRSPKTSAAKHTTLTVVTSRGEREALRVVRDGAVMVASAGSLDPAALPQEPGAFTDNMKCYKVKQIGPPTTTRTTIQVRDMLGDRRVSIKRPSELCVPASLDDEDADAPQSIAGLLCYAAKDTRMPGSQAPAGVTESTTNRLGINEMALRSVHSVCMMAVVDPPTFRGADY